MTALERRAPPAITVFGALAMDIRLRASHRVQANTSNPVAAKETPGGVGHNLAMGLRRLGGQVRLASAVGDDPTAAKLLAELDAAGIDSGAVDRRPGFPTARYWAVLEPWGELAMGLADMTVLETLEPNWLAPAAALPADAWLIDTNLPEPCLAWLLAQAQRPAMVAVETVSVTKATRLCAHLHRVDLLFTNADEAMALVGSADASALRARGVATAILSRGAAGLDIASANGFEHLAALPVQPLDVTGAGDALAAAALYALLMGLDLALAARIGRLAATATLLGRPMPDVADLRATAIAVDKGLHAELARL